MEERRLHPRLNLPLESHYSLDGSELEQVATLLNLSAGGAGIQLPRELETGTQLDFRFVLPPDGDRPATPILARAEVVRIQKLTKPDQDFGFLAGVEFIELGAESLRRIQQFVFARLTEGRPVEEEMPLERRRAEIQKPISIRFDRFDEFESRVSENLSLGGMFIHSTDPKPPGTVFTFEHQLGDDFPLVTGRAEVVWTRARSRGPRMPPGMGVRFLELDGSSRNVIRRLVASKRPARGGGSIAEDLRVSKPAPPTRVSLRRDTEPPAPEKPSEIDKLRQEMARRTREFADQEERLKRQIMELTNREVEHQQRLRTSEGSLDATLVRVHELEEELAERDRRLVEAGYEHEGLNARLLEASGAREALAHELESLAATRQDELAALRESLDATAAEQAGRGQRLEELETENAEARRRLEDVEYREAELRKDNEELRGELERARQALQEGVEAGRGAERLLLEELGSARSDTERLERELALLRSQGSEAEAAQTELGERLDAALSELERERENSETAEAELRAELLRANARVDQMASEAADAANRGAALKQQRVDHEQAVRALEAANRALKTKIARLDAAEPRERDEPNAAEMMLEPVGAVPEVYPVADRPRRRRWAWIPIAALLAATAVAVVFFSPLRERLRPDQSIVDADSAPAVAQPPLTDAEQVARRQRLAGPASQPPVPTQTGTEAEPAGEPQGSLEITEPERRTVGEPIAVVEQWADAWSEQRVEDYLGFYATDFIPPSGMSRTEWEAYRRDRLTAPKSISVSLDGIRQNRLGQDRVEVVFEQSYDADAYSDRVQKTLDLVLVDGGWRILRETAKEIP